MTLNVLKGFHMRICTTSNLIYDISMGRGMMFVIIANAEANTTRIYRNEFRHSTWTN